MSQTSKRSPNRRIVVLLVILSALALFALLQDPLRPVLSPKRAGPLAKAREPATRPAPTKEAKPPSRVVTGPRPIEPPPPRGLPFVGDEGRDDFGYPTMFPDRAALLQLLRSERFDELTAAFEAYQAAFEKELAQRMVAGAGGKRFRVRRS